MTAKEFIAYQNENGLISALRLLVPYFQPYEHFGVRVSIGLAMFMKESYTGNGTFSKLFIDGNNAFGIKGSGYVGETEEVTDGETETMISSFQSYPNIETCIDHYCRIMCGANYFSVRKAETWNDAIIAVATSTYATAVPAGYANSLLYWIDKFQLQDCDTYVFEDRANEVFNTTRFRDKGHRVARVQSLLNDIGYDLMVDGGYGIKTFSAVHDFQTQMKLLPDGVCGINTYLVMEKVKKQLEEPTVIEADETVTEAEKPIEVVEIKKPTLNTVYVSFLKIEGKTKVKGETK